MRTMAVGSHGMTVRKSHSQFRWEKVEEWYSIASSNSSEATNSLAGVSAEPQSD